MLAFAEAARGCNDVRAVTVPAEAEGLTAYALGTGKVRSVVLINRGSQSQRLSIAELGLSKVWPLRLSGPALDSTTGVTLAGHAVAADGSWKAGTEHVLDARDLTLPAASAIVLRDV